MKKIFSLALASALILTPLRGESSPHLAASNFQVVGEAIAPSLSALKTPQQIISSLDTYTTALAILHQGSADRGTLQAATISATTISDLGLLFYDVSKPLFTVLKKISRSQTILGECSLASMLVTPTADREALEKRQSMIRFLVENDEARATLSSFLKEFSKQEGQLLALWNKNDILYGKNMSQSLFGGNIKKKRNAAVMEFKRRFLDAFEPASPFLGFFTGQFIKKLTPFSSKESVSTEGNAATRYWKNSTAKSLTFDGVLGGFTALGAAIAWKTAFSKSRNRKFLRVALKKRFQSLVALGAALTDITEYADSLEGISLPAIEALKEFKSSENTDIQEFFDSLTGDAFRMDKGYWNSSMGKLFAAVPRFLSLKKRICFALSALGELDALVSLATLMKEHEGLKNHFCFAQYKEFSGTPELSITQFWHPNLLPQDAIPNDLYLGGMGTRNMVITGPNAGGKSTISKGMMISVLFAQTLTIVAAEKIVLTPFSLINTYLNIVEDAGNAISQHRAEVRRANELISQISSIPSNQCALTVMDEMFRCTNPSNGAFAAYGIGKVMGQQPNSILVLATHYFKLTELAKETASSFVNYCVKAHKQPNGTFKYPYRLEPGINATVIALDLLAAEGFNQDILKYAHEHLVRVEGNNALPR